MMQNKYTIETLIEKEKLYKLWEITFFGYPLWVHCRDGLSKGSIHIGFKQNKPKIKDLLISTYKTFKFFVRQKKYKKVYFLADRMELLESYREDNEQKKILFIHFEKIKRNRNIDIEYISADFLNVIRFIFRKSVYLFFFKVYKKSLRSCRGLCSNQQIKIAMGDALFLRFLSLCFDSHIEKYYAVAVIPPGEKFLNRLNSFEIQHGVIHKNHVGYMGIPEVKNTLIVYHQNYKKLLCNEKYMGKLNLIEYKKTFLQKTSSRIFCAVIYTQPIIGMQKAIESFFTINNPENIWIQRHPKDTYCYNISEKYFVEDTIPNEVDYPICYTSTIIENFLIMGKNCLIYDIEDKEINIHSVLSVYIQDNSVKLIYFNSLNKIDKYIKEEKSKNEN